MSRKDTPKEASKLQHHWIGPNQVTKTISGTVYLLRSSLEKVLEMHSSRSHVVCSSESEFTVTREIVDLFEDALKDFVVKQNFNFKIENEVLTMLI